MPKEVDERKLEKFAVPMTAFESRRLASYLSRSGMKKGAFARLSMLEKLDRVEREIRVSIAAKAWFDGVLPGLREMWLRSTTREQTCLAAAAADEVLRLSAEVIA